MIFLSLLDLNKLGQKIEFKMSFKDYSDKLLKKKVN